MKIDDKVKESIHKIIKGHETTERDVEIPFLFEMIPDPPKTVLDVGCSGSLALIELNRLGFNAYGIDMRNYHVRTRKFVKHDARKMPFQDNTFDVTCGISTIEHAGLVETPYRTDSSFDEDGDKKVISEMVRVTKQKGVIIITLPYGTGEERLMKWIRFYNKDRIAKLLPKNLIIDNIRYYARIKNKWTVTDEKAASSMYSIYNIRIGHKNQVNGNICIVGHKL